MIIGVLKEIKKLENRVSVLPSGVEQFVKHGHKVLVEKNAGLASGFPDEEYVAAGATIIDTAEAIYAKAEMIMKVKEPQPVEYPLMRQDQIIFTYFHFASSQELTEAVIKSKCHAIAYETITDNHGRLPLLAPMSEVAGRLSIQQGAHFLERKNGGRGILLGGVPGTEPAIVLVLGGGVSGTHAAKMAAGLGAQVYILDLSIDRIRYLNDIMPANVTVLMSNAHNIRELLKKADLVVNCVLIPGGKAPKLITREMLKTMKQGSVIVDISIDQGGGMETSRPTDHENPTFVEEGVIHYCVTNMPGAVPMTSTVALTNATFPYALQIANKGLLATQNPHIAEGANIMGGHVTHRAVAEAFGYDYVNVEDALMSHK